MMEFVNSRVSRKLSRKSGGTARKRPDVMYFDIGDCGRAVFCRKGIFKKIYLWPTNSFDIK